MTTDELRDSVAILLGWHQSIGGHWFRLDQTGQQDTHPIDGTLDQLARLWGEHLSRWRWQRRESVWCACDDHGRFVEVRDTDDEYPNRIALFHAVLVAEGRKG